jgi:membrane protein implicated in regulation of membrane protease activity
MSAFFLASFVAGLALGVYAMLRGVERPPRGVRGEPVDQFGRAIAEARRSLKAPTLGACLTLVGATGYLLTRYTALGPGARLALALLAGVVGIVGAIVLIAKWVVPAAQHDIVDERYLLQGHPARVSAPIRGAADGEITYDIGGTQYAAKARSIDDVPVAVGTDVIIERVEDGVAYVEPWVQVEQRI